MRVQELWRFPVKSLQGERVDSVEIQAQGMAGDRAYSLFDTATGFGLTARRVPQLLFAAAAYRPDGGVTITLPDGSTADDDEALSRWLDRPVTLRSAAEPGDRVFENPADFENDDEWEPFSGATGAFHDSGRANVSLVSTATIGGWPLRRFRANVVLDGADEDALVGNAVGLGQATLDVRMRIQRCVMVTRPQPDGAGGPLDKDLDVLRRLHREREGRLSVGTVVTTPGTVRVGDELHLL